MPPFISALRSVIAKNKIEKPYLGVYYTMITKSLAKEKNLAIDHGAYVGLNNQKPTVDGSPAAQAGIRSGDIIIRIDGEDLTEANSLSSVIARHDVGDKVQLTILRDGRELSLDLTLEPYRQ